jgi:hypothetical protein
MTTYSSPAEEIAALRALIASIRGIESWHYDDLDFLPTGTVRDLIDDETDDDQNVWVLGDDSGEAWTLADPTEASAKSKAIGRDDEGRELRPMTRAEAKVLTAAYRARRAAEDEQHARERAEAAAAREEARLAAEAHALANPRFIEGYDFFQD